MSLADALAPAIRLAERGVATAWTSTLRISAKLPAMARFPETLEIFAPGGRPLNPGGAYSRGDLLVQKDLGATLRTLARDGGAAFYRGEIAREIDRWARAAGGLISAADLAAYEPIVHEAAQRTSFGAWEVNGIPGPSGCFTAQETLNILDEVPREQLPGGPAGRHHLYALASGRAFADRRHWSRAQWPGEIPYGEILSREHAARHARDILDQRGDSAMPGPGTGAESTTHLMVVDRERVVVSLTATLADNFGSAAMVPGTGIL